MASWVSAAIQSTTFGFNITADLWPVVFGAVSGGVNVLPTNSMMAMCMNNATRV